MIDLRLKINEHVVKEGYCSKCDGNVGISEEGKTEIIRDIYADLKKHFGKNYGAILLLKWGDKHGL